MSSFGNSASISFEFLSWLSQSAEFRLNLFIKIGGDFMFWINIQIYFGFSFFKCHVRQFVWIRFRNHTKWCCVFIFFSRESNSSPFGGGTSSPCDVMMLLHSIPLFTNDQLINVNMQSKCFSMRTLFVISFYMHTKPRIDAHFLRHRQLRCPNQKCEERKKKRQTM